MKTCINCLEEKAEPEAYTAPTLLTVEQLTLNGEYMRSFKSLKAAATSVKGVSGGIARVCYKKQQTAYGFKWRFPAVVSTVPIPAFP